MNSKNSLLIFRNEINNIDEKIVELLSKRKNLVLKIAEFKIENKQPIRDIEREKKILKKLVSLGEKKNLNSKYITTLFHLIISESVLNQEKLLRKFYNNNKIKLTSFSCLGPKGSYSNIAVSEYGYRNFQKYLIKECVTFKEVISSVEKKESDYAILPIENTCSGYINEIFDILKKTNLFIVGEINIVIKHCLLTIKKISLCEIKTVYSHPQPFQQCSNFIEKFPQWKIKYTNSTSDAIKKISKYNDIYNAALGSQIGGEIYGLNVLATNIANQTKNITRFILLNRIPANISEKIPTKTTLILSVEKKSSALKKILLILQEKNILFKVCTFQVAHHNSSEEMFYLDLQINLSSKLMQNTLKEIQKITNFIKILGCYQSDKTFLKTTEPYE